MKPKFRSLAAAFSPSTRGALIICASLSTSASLHAASQTWDGDTDANWATVTNWVSNTGAPGVVAPAAAGLSADTATFNAALVGGTRGGATDPITYENSRQVRHIAFNTAPGPFVFGVSGGNQLWLGHTGSVTMSADVASPQTFASSVAIRLPSSTNGTYTVTNNASSSSATLSFSTIASGSATSRPISFSLGGSNTGENTVGAFTDSGALRITKSGVGTWVVTGASVITAQTDVGVVGGWEINGGTLAAANNSALGSLGTANSLGVTINDTGTLEIRNGITLDNGLSLNLNNGGTIKAVGTSGTNGRINVGTAAATSVTINTNASGDVFTIGNGTNDLTGGAADSVINIGGPGTVIQNVASNYAGKWMLNSGTLQLGSPTALGATVSTGVGFGASSTAILETLGKSPTITSLNSNATPGTPVIRNGDATLAATLTVNNTTSDTYAGTITDGSTGTLGLTKGGTGTLTLSGTNTYTGDTVVNNGTLKINSAASTPVVTVDSGGTLGGTGSISGAVTVKNLGRLAPGNSVGTLTAGSLTIESGAILDYEFGTGNDLAVSTTSGGLTLNGGGINLYQDGTTNQFATIGSYNLFQYTGTLNGSVNNLSVLNPDPTKVYAFSANGSNVVLDITAAIISQWNLATGGSWASAGSWSGSGVPNASGATALFGSALASPGTVTLDGNKTVATVAFDNTNSYTISPTTTESLILANTGQAQITGTNGSHQITAPITLNSNTVVAVANSGDTISLSGVISGSGNLTKSGPGTLSLSGSNNFTGNVAISAGTLSIGTGSLGASTSLSMGASTLRWATGVTDDVSNAGSRTIQFLPGDSTWDTNGNDVIVAGNIGQSGSGNLIKVGTGNLTLSGNNTYTGTTTINGGTLTVTDDDSLGAAPGSATPNSLVINSATLGTSGAFTLSANRGVTLGSATSTVEAAAASNVVCGGIVAGSGKLNVTGTGIFDLAATNTYSGGTVINTGATLNLSAAGTPGTGQIALAGGTLSISRDSYLEDDILIDAAQTGTIDATANRVGVRALTGSGEVTLITRNGGNNAGNQGDGFRFQGNNAGFTGVVNLKSGTGTVNTFTALFNTNTGNNFDGNFSNATFQMSDFARIGGVNNSGGNTMTIGALSGDTTAILAGADYAGTQTYNIGGKGLDTTFAGVIENGSAGNANIIKSGTGKLTLTGTNTYGGTTTVNAGTLAVENASALGADTTGTTIAGGDVDAKVTITGGVTLTEPWTLAGRQGTNADSPAIVSLSGNNILSGFVSPATSGDRYNIQCDAGSLTVEGGFAPGGAVTGNRFLQIFGNGSGEWSGAIQNGTATVHLNVKSAGTWTLSGANDYTGDTLVDSGATVVLSSTGHLKFAPTSNGLSNLIYGLGTATLDGVIDIDLNAADNTDNNSWQLVDVASVTYGSNFDVPGFTKSGTTWTMVSGPSTWTFEQTSGILSVDTVPGYSSWIGTFGLSGGDAAAGFDYDKDGISNGIEYVIGGDPANANDNDKLPTLTKVPGGFEFVYRRTDLSSLDNPSVLHDADLVGTWTTAVNGVDGVTITVSDDFYGAAVDKVTVFIPSTDPKHFARLNVVIP